MASLPQADLIILSEGTRFLARRPWVVLAMALLGMALLALPPLIQLRAGLPDDLLVNAALSYAALIPLELYLIPRFLIEADASAGFDPGKDWEAHFEERFLRAFGAKMLFLAATGIGLALVIVPGLLVMLAFGWVPLLVLLRGASLAEAVRASLRIMASNWRRMVFAGCALALVYLTFGMSLGFLLEKVVPEPSVRTRLVHPLLWLSNFLASGVSIWLSACFLALFRRLEQPAAPR